MNYDSETNVLVHHPAELLDEMARDIEEHALALHQALEETDDGPTRIQYVLHTAEMLRRVQLRTFERVRRVAGLAAKYGVPEAALRALLQDASLAIKMAGAARVCLLITAMGRPTPKLTELDAIARSN